MHTVDHLDSTCLERLCYRRIHLLDGDATIAAADFVQISHHIVGQRRGRGIDMGASLKKGVRPAGPEIIHLGYISSSNTRPSANFAHIPGLPVVRPNSLDSAFDGIVIDIEMHHQPNRWLLMTRHYLAFFEMQAQRFQVFLTWFDKHHIGVLTHL